MISCRFVIFLRLRYFHGDKERSQKSSILMFFKRKQRSHYVMSLSPVFTENGPYIYIYIYIYSLHALYCSKVKLTTVNNKCNTGPEVIKLFSCSTQVSVKLVLSQMLKCQQLLALNIYEREK